ncbi:hypothetical protein AWC27_01165 [Mycobacterium szulgai]|uniref:Uncharacterized protein n=1 Tax=Mycobacterium szulgai TaxID=1787 RepID=A0A1X2FE02_MYCSZ|nr:hypothetical protein AWC27_01165 [Mycobacterium szulgai]
MTHEGIINAAMNRVYAATITETGNERNSPPWSGTTCPGNHRSHWNCSPRRWTSRSHGSARAYCGLILDTFSLNHERSPVQPTRSAIADGMYCTPSTVLIDRLLDERQ